MFSFSIMEVMLKIVHSEYFVLLLQHLIYILDFGTYCFDNDCKIGGQGFVLRTLVEISNLFSHAALEDFV